MLAGDLSVEPLSSWGIPCRDACSESSRQNARSFLEMAHFCPGQRDCVNLQSQQMLSYAERGGVTFARVSTKARALLPQPGEERRDPAAATTDTVPLQDPWILGARCPQSSSS